MSILSKLLRFARAVVQSVVNIINQQINLVGDIVRRPIEMMIQQVVSGSWKGVGANKFVEEMQSLVLPSLSDLTQSFTRTSSNINKAMDILTNADKQASSVAGGLMDVFKGIFH